ncbi:hypothetical protein HZS91_01053 [Xanthomonas citri pv. citri]|nr:hypothetical protein HZS91_01053 [Xanthomonas citri pv. citri]
MPSPSLSGETHEEAFVDVARSHLRDGRAGGGPSRRADGDDHAHADLPDGARVRRHERRRLDQRPDTRAGGSGLRQRHRADRVVDPAHAHRPLQLRLGDPGADGNARACAGRVGVRNPLDATGLHEVQQQPGQWRQAADELLRRLHPAPAGFRQLHVGQGRTAVRDFPAKRAGLAPGLRIGRLERQRFRQLPRWWYIRRSYGLISGNGAVSKRGYAMSQFARFVRPGSVRVGATEHPYSDVSVTAYRTPDNKLVVVAVNTGTGHQRLDLTLPSGTATQFAKYSTSSTLNVGFGGNYSVVNGKTSLYVDPQSVATLVGN